MDLTKNKNYVAYHQNLDQQTSQYNTLHNNYTLLFEKYDQIHSLRRQFQTLDSAYADESEKVTTNYYQYIVLLFVSILLFFVLVRYLPDGQTGGGSRSILDKNTMTKVVIVSIIMFFIYYFFYILKSY